MYVYQLGATPTVFAQLLPRLRAAVAARPPSTAPTVTLMPVTRLPAVAVTGPAIFQKAMTQLLSQRAAATAAAAQPTAPSAPTVAPIIAPASPSGPAAPVSPEVVAMEPSAAMPSDTSVSPDGVTTAPADQGAAPADQAAAPATAAQEAGVVSGPPVVVWILGGALLLMALAGKRGSRVRA